MEKKTNSLYVQDCSSKKSKSNEKITYFICHRSFSKIEQKKVQHLKTKHKGTNKIGTACPSVLVSTVTEMGVTVEFHPMHKGHDCEVGRMNLTKSERISIAGSFSMYNFVFQFILL